MSDAPAFEMPPISVDGGPTMPPPLPPRYVGGGLRIGASFLDGFILNAPASLALTYLQKSNSNFLWGGILFAVLGSLLRIELLRRFGGTPGKRLLKFHVRCVDGSPVSYKHAFMRESVNMLMGIALGVTEYYLDSTAPAAQNDAPADYDNEGLSLAMNAVISFATLGVLALWVLVDFAVMVSDRHFRALHDKMAGTVVVFDDKPRR